MSGYTRDYLSDLQTRDLSPKEQKQHERALTRISAGHDIAVDSTKETVDDVISKTGDLAQSTLLMVASGGLSKASGSSSVLSKLADVDGKDLARHGRNIQRLMFGRRGRKPEGDLPAADPNEVPFHQVDRHQEFLESVIPEWKRKITQEIDDYANAADVAALGTTLFGSLWSLRGVVSSEKDDPTAQDVREESPEGFFGPIEDLLDSFGREVEKHLFQLYYFHDIQIEDFNLHLDQFDADIDSTYSIGTLSLNSGNAVDSATPNIYEIAGKKFDLPVSSYLEEVALAREALEPFPLNDLVRTSINGDFHGLSRSMDHAAENGDLGQQPAHYRQFVVERTTEAINRITDRASSTLEALGVAQAILAGVVGILILALVALTIAAAVSSGGLGALGGVVTIIGLIEIASIVEAILVGASWGTILLSIAAVSHLNSVGFKAAGGDVNAREIFNYDPDAVLPFKLSANSVDSGSSTFDSYTVERILDDEIAQKRVIQEVVNTR